MRKLLYLLVGGLLGAGVTACDNEPKNPGDFSVKSEISIKGLVSAMTGTVYNLNVERSIDTVFNTGVVVYDSIFDTNGEYLSRTPDTIWVPANYTTRYTFMEPVVLESFADTLNLSLGSNAKWLCPTPESSSAQWLYTDQAGGGGDYDLTIRSTRNRNFLRKSYTYLTIYSSDSTVFYKIPFGQKGEKDTE